jgi:hypothetical protein
VSFRGASVESGAEQPTAMKHGLRAGDVGVAIAFAAAVDGDATRANVEGVIPHEDVIREGSEFLSSRNSKLAATQETESWAQGWRQGFVDGSRIASRNMCVIVVRQHHAAVLSLVETHIKACPSHFQLVEWAIASAELSDEAFVTLVTGKPAVGAGRARATRPSRRSPKRH